MIRVMCLAVVLALFSVTSGNVQEILTLTDTSGTVMRLNTFEIRIIYGKDLKYDEGALDNIYGFPKAIPIQQENGVTLFVTIDNISEYKLIGDTAILILVDGRSVKGKPLEECTFSGKTLLGDISVPSYKVKEMKFNPEQMKLFLQNKTTIQGNMGYGWPEEFKSTVDVILNSRKMVMAR